LATFGYWLRGQGTSQTDRLRMLYTAFGLEHATQL
jgi:hypothetical protein